MATASVTLTPSSEGKVAAAAIKVANAAPEEAAEVLYRRDELVQRTNELGALLASAYEDKRPLVMPILKGGFIFAADLVRAFSPCPDGLEVEFVSARSYGARTETSGEVEVSFDAAVVSGRHVLMVDDLCDSGLTLLTVRDRLIAAGAASVRSVVLLDKKERRKVEYDPDYIGFDCPNKWVAGAGMDTHQLWRASGDVWVPSKAAIAVAIGRHA